MEKENNVTPITESPAEQATEEVSLTVKFSKPYRFEDKTYKEIDLSGLDNLTAEDMIAADKYLTRNGNVTVMPEMSLEYACFIASKATDLPVEFFRRLSPKDAIKIKNRVANFFYGEE